MILISPNFPTSVFDFDTCRFRFDNLNAYKNETLVINFASEHWGESSLIYQLYDDLSKNGFDFWILSHHPNDHNKLERLVYYPWWYVYSKVCFPRNIDIEKTKKFSLGCLHGKPRPHRIVNYFAIADRFPKEKICSTIYDTTPLPWRHDDPELFVEELERWEQIRHQFSQYTFNLDHSDLTLPASSDSYLYLVPETTIIDRIFITEKTWRPIAAGQLFLIFGNPGTVAHLRNLGVDMYDDIISHDYDSIENWRDRLGRIHDIIQDLCDQDLQQIWDETYERRKENRRKLFSGEFMTQNSVPFEGLLEQSYVPYKVYNSPGIK